MALPELPSNITIPDIDLRDEEATVVEVIDALPAEITDRNRSSAHIKLIEGVGAFYGKLLYLLNYIPYRLQLLSLALVGIEQTLATPATVTLTFTRAGAVGDVTIPAGQVVKTGTGVTARAFATDAELLIPGASASGEVTATATTAGTDTNVAPDTLTIPDPTIAGVTVTNADFAIGGSADETIEEMIARAPLAIRSSERCVTDEDFELHATQYPGVERALILGADSILVMPGHVQVHILADLSAVANPALIAAVDADLQARTFPGVTVDVLQSPVTLIQITSVEVKVLPGYGLFTGTAPVATAIEARLTTLIDALGDWEYGERVYRNELISALDSVAGVDRIGEIEYQISDDYGATWSVAVVLPAAGVAPTDPVKGLFHYAGDTDPAGDAWPTPNDGIAFVVLS